MSRWIFAFFIFCVSNPVCSDDFQSLIDTERAFARHSVEKGTKEAFLTYLAEDGILFRPHPVEGKKFMKDQPASKGVLDWRPSFAGISSSGVLGFTTGPYEFRPESGETRHGHFVTVWKKQPDGSFRAALDTGSPHPAQNVNTTVQRLHEGMAPKASATHLEEAEGEFLKQPDASYFSEKGRLMRNGLAPITGKENIRRNLQNAKCATIQFESDSDLGYVYGKCGEPEPTAYYVRIWERQTTPDWKIVIDVVSEVSE